MTTATYKGTGIFTSGWSSPARDEHPEADDNDALAGETGMTEGFGGHSGDRLPNLQIEHHSRPAQTHGLPADHRTNQNPLTAAKPKGAAAAGRGTNYSTGKRGR